MQNQYSVQLSGFRSNESINCRHLWSVIIMIWYWCHASWMPYNFDRSSLLLSFADPISSGLAPGPYGLIFSSFVLFFYDIPVSKRFRIFNIQLSDKSFVYFVGLQLLLSSWKLSFIPGVYGVLVGFSYRLNVFCIRRIKKICHIYLGICFIPNWEENKSYTIQVLILLGFSLAK